MGLPQATEFVLPDFFAPCPFTLGLTNPHADTVFPEARAWIGKFLPFSGLAWHCDPWAGKEGFRTICDFQNLLFLMDELTDEMSGEDARVVGESFIRVLKDPSVDNESIIAQATREFRTRIADDVATKSVWFGRFVAICKSYADATYIEAEHRENNRVLDLDDFVIARRENSAVRCCFSINEHALGIDLPDSVFEDPEFLRMYFDAVDMIVIVNDVYSYNMEQAKGLAGNNVVTVLEQALGVDLQAAVNRGGEMFAQKMEGYVRGRGVPPSWGAKVDADVEHFFDSVDQWIVGNLEWSTETSRYLGPDHEEIMKTGRVVLRKIESKTK
ncbi:terpenoid synthase [Coniophora puteana RWD-64-598 SS2]|uniref:Terpene synthase n=1 Tax=Coniophora puteana (strain RWD-64-598) TaxID=741705 RepID=A0A5M3MFS2_CONPW|nr:terpenoid synthase [Coniophora puteana RWD-64-598 SS2]EIW77846.1 terpenoid synthase [Coniophora puteana RWD-64-598 SS2]